MRGLKMEQLGLTEPHFRLRDVCREALLSISGQPVRSLLTTIGTVLGAGAFVATLGLTSTLSQQVSATFDLRRATEVTVVSTDENFNPHAPATNAEVGSARWLTRPALDKVIGLAGVESAGRRVVLPNVAMNRFAQPGIVQTRFDLIGMDSDAFSAIDMHIVSGRTFDSFHDRTGAPVALLPSRLARELGVTLVGGAIFIESRAFTVIGIFDEVDRRPETILGAVVPYESAQPIAAASRSDPPRYDLIIETLPGAAQLIGFQAPLALDPSKPQSLRAVAPPDPQTLRTQVQGNVILLCLILSAVSLAIGAVSIGNATTAGIAARVPEIGLRRAMGAERVHVFAQLLGETTLLGAVGGVVGAVLGVFVTVVVSLANGWQPVIDIRIALLACGVGAVAGLGAGLAPAFRAMRIEPVAALQR